MTKCQPYVIISISKGKEVFKMSTIYIINDGINTWGIVENKREVAPFIIFTEVLEIDDRVDNPFSIVDLLKCDCKKENVVANLENLSFELQKIIFEKFGIFIIEEEVWSYEEYLHNKS